MIKSPATRFGTRRVVSVNLSIRKTEESIDKMVAKGRKVGGRSHAVRGDCVRIHQ